MHSMVTTTSEMTGLERRRALRALLRRPMLPSAGETSEEYTLVRRHSEWLKDWLMNFPAWELHVDPQVARLRKTPGDLDETRPAVDRASGTIFTRRRYVFLCLAFAALQRSDRQTTLSEVTRKIVELIAADPELQASGVVVDLANYDHRRDLVHAIRLLIDLGVLDKLDGEEREFLNRQDMPDALYEINHPALSAVWNLPASPSAAVQRRQGGLADDLLAQRQSIRARLVRGLLDDPILYLHDLDEEERTYLAEHRGYLLRQIQEATGLVAEIRSEGIAMMDDEGDLTDLKLPADADNAADGQLSLILAQRLAESARADPGSAIPLEVLEEYVQRELRDSGAKAWLMDAVWRLQGLRLLELTPAGVVPLPACARYALE
jgi:uncharacterized protein (TIGR02678 family)